MIKYRKNGNGQKQEKRSNKMVKLTILPLLKNVPVPWAQKRHQYSSKRAFMRPTKSLALMCGAERGQTAAKETAGKQANGRVLQCANER